MYFKQDNDNISEAPKLVKPSFNIPVLPKVNVSNTCVYTVILFLFPCCQMKCQVITITMHRCTQCSPNFHDLLTQWLSCTPMSIHSCQNLFLFHCAKLPWCSEIQRKRQAGWWQSYYYKCEGKCSATKCHCWCTQRLVAQIW